MEEAIELDYYLPLSFKNPGEQEYIAFLWDAFETNYKFGNYQFAFLAYHMLTMCFVFFNIWQIKQTRPDDFSKGLIGFARDEEKLLAAYSPYDFSIPNESSILSFLRLIACDNSKIGAYTKLVRDRNEIAHSNGHIFFSTKAALDIKIAEILRVVVEIENHSQYIIKDCYYGFLLRSCDSEQREYTDPVDQIREELIHRNYFSQKDVEFCLGIEVTSLADRPQFDNSLNYIFPLYSNMKQKTHNVDGLI